MVLQGSGWGWLGYSGKEGRLVLTTTANQDPASTQVRWVHMQRLLLGSSLHTLSCCGACQST